MSNVSPRTLKLLNAQLEHLAMEVEIETNRRRLEVVQERSKKIERSIRPIKEVFGDSPASR